MPSRFSTLPPLDTASSTTTTLGAQASQSQRPTTNSKSDAFFSASWLASAPLCSPRATTASSASPLIFPTRPQSAPTEKCLRPPGSGPVAIVWKNSCSQKGKESEVSSSLDARPSASTSSSSSPTSTPLSLTSYSSSSSTSSPGLASACPQTHFVFQEPSLAAVTTSLPSQNPVPCHNHCEDLSLPVNATSTIHEVPSDATTAGMPSTSTTATMLSNIEQRLEAAVEELHQDGKRSQHSHVDSQTASSNPSSPRRLPEIETLCPSSAIHATTPTHASISPDASLTPTEAEKDLLYTPIHPFVNACDTLHQPLHRSIFKATIVSLKRRRRSSSLLKEDKSAEEEHEYAADARSCTQKSGKKVCFEDFVVVVDVFSADDYPGRRGPLPIQRLTMRDVLELRQIKIELGVYNPHGDNSFRKMTIESTPSDGGIKAAITLECGPNGEDGPLTDEPEQDHITRAADACDVGPSSSAASSASSSLFPRSSASTFTTSSPAASATGPTLPEDLKSSKTLIYLEPASDPSSKSASSGPGSPRILDQTIGFPQGSHPQSALAPSLTPSSSQSSRETSPDSTLTSTSSSPSLSLSCSPSASESDFGPFDGEAYEEEDDDDQEDRPRRSDKGQNKRNRQAYGSGVQQSILEIGIEIENESMRRRHDFEVIPHEIRSSLPIPDHFEQPKDSARSLSPPYRHSPNSTPSAETPRTSSPGGIPRLSSYVASESRNAEIFGVSSADGTSPLLPPPRLQPVTPQSIFTTTASTAMLDGPWGLRGSN